jgi:hypothetical protein
LNVLRWTLEHQLRVHRKRPGVEGTYVRPTYRLASRRFDMRYVFADPSHHATAWLSLAAGLLLLVYLLLKGEMAGAFMVGLLVGVSFTVLGIAELLPGRWRPLSVVLRIVGLLFAVGTIAVSLNALLF